MLRWLTHFVLIFVEKTQDFSFTQISNDLSPFCSSDKNYLPFLKKLEIELPYDPAIPLLGIHTEETRSERDTCTPTVHCSTVYNSQDMEAT